MLMFTVEKNTEFLALILSGSLIILDFRNKGLECEICSLKCTGYISQTNKQSLA